MGSLAATWHGGDDPDRPVVAFVHGAPDTGRSFLPVVAHLDGLRLLTYDRRGYGRSIGAQPRARALDDHVADLVALLARDVPATVVAHSFGCCVAMLASVRHPELIASLALWEPPVPWEEWWPERSRQAVARIVEEPDPEAVGERLFRTVIGDAAWDRLDAAAQGRRRAEGLTFVEDARAQLTRQFDLRDVMSPCVVAHGSLTWAPMIETTRRVAKELGADLVEEVEVAGAAHFGHVTHPAEFAALVTRAVRLA
jgi:pimeloyl-ACP methyl ester carboxylesterase